MNLGANTTTKKEEAANNNKEEATNHHRNLEIQKFRIKKYRNTEIKKYRNTEILLTEVFSIGKKNKELGLVPSSFESYSLKKNSRSPYLYNSVLLDH